MVSLSDHVTPELSRRKANKAEVRNNCLGEVRTVELTRLTSDLLAIMNGEIKHHRCWSLYTNLTINEGAQIYVDQR